MKKNQTNHKRIVYSLSLVILLTASMAMAASDPVVEMPALVVVDGDTEIMSVVATVQDMGGEVSHMILPRVLIGKVPESAEEILQEDDDVTVYRGPVDISEHEDWEKETVYAVTAWNYNYMGGSVDAGLNEPPSSPESPVYDTEIQPDITSYLSHSGYDSVLPYGAGFQDTSSYLVGSVAVGVLFVESNGVIDEDTENWTEEEETKATAEIQNGLNWLATQAPIDIQMVYEWHYGIPVGYEPISRPHTDDDLWEQQAMHHLGYTNPHYLVNEYMYANDLRQKYNTDWAFIIFVVDDSEDEDNAFADGLYAYSFLGGPRMVVSYSNSIWGIANMDSIVAHETGHIFWALDQNCTSEVEKTAVSGYLGGENENSEWTGESCTTTEPCIMKGEPMYNSQVEVSTRTQLGWIDSDSDGILDVLDTEPAITVNYSDGTCTGTAVVSPHPNLNPFTQGNGITLNTITQVEYRVDEGDWESANPTDGTFDRPEESFDFAVAVETGEHTIEVRAQNSAGNWQSETLTFTKEEPVLTCELSAAPATIGPGDTIAVVMTVSNTGEAPVVSVIPTVTAPECTEIVSAPQPEEADIPAEESATFEWVYTIIEGAESLQFTGSAAGQSESGASVQSEEVESNTVHVVVEPELNSDITALLYGVIEDNTITVTMEVHNAGETILENVTPSDMNISCTGTAAVNLIKGPVPQSPFTLESGETKTFTWTYTTTPGSQGGTVVFTATASGEADQTTITSEIAKATVAVKSPAIVSTFIVATPRTVQVGETITVAMTVQNIGQALAIDVIPSVLDISGTGAAELVSGPSRPSIEVEGRTFEIILWTYTATAPGEVTFSGSVQGVDTSTGETLSVPVKSSNTVAIEPGDADPEDNDVPEEPEDNDVPDEPDTPEEPEEPEDNDVPDEPDTPEEPEDNDVPDEPDTSPCAYVEKTVQKVAKLLKDAKAAMVEKQRQNRDVRLCRKVLREAELYLAQAQQYLKEGKCKEASQRATFALLKVYELLNLLENL
ncbi:MAG: hypothetical protein PVF58_02815 [Candidatus Methanofastidiosia archaeon]|jgi:hypothetical protein